MFQPESRPMPRCGFTLIELLVVVTIIIALLALLMPAIDKAVYNAQLTVCQANVHAVVTGAVSYASQNRGYYPARPALRASNERCICIKATFYNVNWADDRPVLQGYISVNGHLNCPLTKRIDLENSLRDTALFSPIALWFGVQYKLGDPEPDKGMNKIGDRFTAEGKSFNILAGDWDGIYLDTTPPHHFSTHPDREGIMWDWVEQDTDYTNQWTGGPDTTTPGLQVTWSYWHTNSGQSRGMLDNNYGFDDGSVGRYNDAPPYAGDQAVPKEPEGWVWIPSYESGNERARYKVQLPKPR